HEAADTGAGREGTRRLGHRCEATAPRAAHRAHRELLVCSAPPVSPAASVTGRPVSLAALCHWASSSTYARSSGPNQGGWPAAAFCATWAAEEVAGIATVTRGSDRTHFKRAF